MELQPPTTTREQSPQKDLGLVNAQMPSTGLARPSNPEGHWGRCGPDPPVPGPFPGGRARGQRSGATSNCAAHKQWAPATRAELRTESAQRKAGLSSFLK